MASMATLFLLLLASAALANAQQQQNPNPYVFQAHHFATRIQSQHGRVRVLPKFTDRAPELLRGIQNYRVMLVEVDPQTFVLPSHWDADAVLFVVQGKGRLSLIGDKQRQSFNLQQNDLMVIRAGITVYLINNDDNQKLIIAKLIRPISTAPGQFVPFYVGGGRENPQSVLRVFSIELLEAAFNARRVKVEELIGQVGQGEMVKVTPEQSRELSQQQDEGQSDAKINIYQQQSPQSNQYGQLFHVDGNTFNPIRDLNLEINLAIINQGAMSGPVISTRAVKVIIALDGEGYGEMACPHLFKPQQATGAPRYYRVQVPLRAETVLIVPPGHPLIVVASKKRPLRLLSFLINGDTSEIISIAGQNNFVLKMERVAKVLTFGKPDALVDGVFGNQNETLFYAGPQQQPWQPSWAVL